jgi:hypothetical protein
LKRDGNFDLTSSARVQVTGNGKVRAQNCPILETPFTLSGIKTLEPAEKFPENRGVLIFGGGSDFRSFLFAQSVRFERPI